MKGNIPTMIGLGRLVDMVIRGAKGQRQRVTPSSELWLAWKSGTRDLVILRPGHGKSAVAKRGASERHKTFHGAVPTQTRSMEWPTPSGNVQSLGLIESVTYVATGIRSPSKGLHHWVHHFGDRGEHGHGTAQPHALSHYPERCMPRLDVDQAGHWYVIRQPGNRFTVRDWILG